MHTGLKHNNVLLRVFTQTLQQMWYPGLPLTLTLLPVSTPSPAVPLRSPISYYKGLIAERALQNFWGNSTLSYLELWAHHRGSRHYEAQRANGKRRKETVNVQRSVPPCTLSTCANGRLSKPWALCTANPKKCFLVSSIDVSLYKKFYRLQSAVKKHSESQGLMYEIKGRLSAKWSLEALLTEGHSTYMSRQTIELELAFEGMTSKKTRLPKSLNLYLLNDHAFQVLDKKKPCYTKAKYFELMYFKGKNYKTHSQSLLQ